MAGYGSVGCGQEKGRIRMGTADVAGGAGKRGRRRLWAAGLAAGVVAVAAVACLVAVSSTSSLGGWRRVELKEKGGDFLSEIERDVSDERLSRRSAVRDTDYDDEGGELDTDGFRRRGRRSGGGISGGGGSSSSSSIDSIYGTRAPELKGVKVDSWPWQGKMGGGGSSIEGMLQLGMGFEDKPHANPMLSPRQRERLKAEKRRRDARLMAGIRDERMEREERKERGGRRTHRQREEEEAARRAHWHHSQLLRSINRPLDVHGPAPKPRADGWDGHNDKCSDDTPNCNRLADIGIRVNGMPQDLETDTMASSPQAEGGASAVMKDRNVILATRGLAKMLGADARLATHLSRDGSSSISKARREKALADSLQDGVYALEELGSLQALSDETGNSTNSTEGEGEEEEEERWSLFTKGFKWYWLDPERKSLEKAGINVDGLPWGAEEPKVQKWETSLLASLGDSATDARQLADRDMLAEEEGGDGNATAAGGGDKDEGDEDDCSEANPNCHHLEKIGVNVNTWPWARAEREWEARLGEELGKDATKAQALAEIESQAEWEIEKHLKGEQSEEAKRAKRAARRKVAGEEGKLGIETDRWPWD